MVLPPFKFDKESISDDMGVVKMPGVGGWLALSLSDFRDFLAELLWMLLINV